MEILAQSLRLVQNQTDDILDKVLLIDHRNVCLVEFDAFFVDLAQLLANLVELLLDELLESLRLGKHAYQLLVLLIELHILVQGVEFPSLHSRWPRIEHNLAECPVEVRPREQLLNHLLLQPSHLLLVVQVIRVFRH